MKRIVSAIALVTCILPLVMTPTSQGGTAKKDPVVAWIDSTATPIRSTDPASQSLDDLTPLLSVVGKAKIVGLGESPGHTSGTVFRLKQREVRLLVERDGFRTIAWEEDWAHGVEIDRYIRTGVGDPVALAKGSSGVYRTQEMVGMIKWMRAYNLAHGNALRFVGADLTQLRQLSFDEMTRYLQCAAPQRVADFQSLTDQIRPHAPPPNFNDPLSYQVFWYLSQSDKQPLLNAAQATVAFIQANKASACTDPAFDDALEHAKEVLGWYQYYASFDQNLRDQFLADTVTSWQQRTGSKVIFWAASLHVAANPLVTYAIPPNKATGPLCGGILRQRYGSQYVPIDTMFNHGGFVIGFADPHGPYAIQVPPPSKVFIESELGKAKLANFLLVLHAGSAKASASAGKAVRAWLNAPATLRIIAHIYDPKIDAQFMMGIDNLSAGFAAILYVRNSTATQMLPYP